MRYAKQTIKFLKKNCTKNLIIIPPHSRRYKAASSLEYKLELIMTNILASEAEVPNGSFDILHC